MNSRQAIELTPIQQQALANEGLVQGDSFVLMSSEVYRDLMGVGADADLAASLVAIHQGLDDAEAGRVRPFREPFAELR